MKGWTLSHPAPIESNPLEFLDLPVPEPGEGEVRVRVAISAVNPGDTKKRSGKLGAMAFERITPHSDGAGVMVHPGSEHKSGQRQTSFEPQAIPGARQRTEMTKRRLED